MSTLKQAANEFLSHKKIAVAGVSRKGDTAANAIYKKLKATSYDVFPVNPFAEKIEGDICYPDLESIPGNVEGVVIGTKPDATLKLVEECGKLKIEDVWIHQSFGNGSYDEKAVQRAKELGLKIIPGGCPMMFCEPVDVAHKCFRWFFDKTGKLPKEIF
ncbi:MAG TPA: CoA-binding protein [Ignavibacteriaceae bacterium]|nr:CoA-binding protein [Ignavibacteriaceae bacterium]